MSNQVPEDARHEVKFVAYDSHRHTLLQWLRLNPAGFVVAHPDRLVNNIYFDSHDYIAFNENLLGASSRIKVRYRWYGISPGPDAGTLEIKRRRNCFGWKFRFEVDQSPYRTGADWNDVRQALLAQLPPEAIRTLNANPLTVLINRYYRKYFVTADGKVRATVDTRQMVFDQRFRHYPNLRHRANLPSTVVVEFKFDRKDRELGSQILQGLPLRVSRHSKYINGVRAIQGY